MFNRRKDVLLLYGQLIAHIDGKRKKEEIWSVINPGQKFNITQWHLLTSRLFKRIEDYLSYSELMKNDTSRILLLAKSLRTLKQERFFQTAIQSARKSLEKQPHQPASYLHTCFEVEYEYLEYITSYNRKDRTNLQQTSDALDAYFMASKLKQACISISRKTINREEYQINFLAETILFIEKNPVHLTKPAVALYFYCYKAIVESSREIDFVNLRQAIETHGHAFPPSEIRDVYLIAINFCIRKLNSGESAFISEALELYRLSLQKGFLMEEGHMPESTFSNIVTLSLKVGEFELAESFIEEFHSVLKPVFREPLRFYSLGKLLYEKGDHDESLRCLARVETKTPWLMLGGKTLQLKIYYEQGEIEALESLLESLRVFLQRRKDIGYHKENYENLVYFTKQLLHFPYKSKEEKKKIIESINNANILTEKEWFLNQMEKY